MFVIVRITDGLHVIAIARPERSRTGTMRSITLGGYEM
jgi:hypothetical protein